MKPCQPLLVTAVASLLAVLPACGFHLRGEVELPTALQETYLDSENPFTGMARAMRQELEAAGGRITESSEQASSVLHILRETSQNRILSVGSTGKASEYELFNEVVFSLDDAQGAVLIKPQTLRMTRDLVFDETELLGKLSEAEGIHRQMRRNLARQIIIRIKAGLRQQ